MKHTLNLLLLIPFLFQATTAMEETQKKEPSKNKWEQPYVLKHIGDLISEKRPVGYSSTTDRLPIVCSNNNQWIAAPSFDWGATGAFATYVTESKEYYNYKLVAPFGTKNPHNSHVVFSPDNKQVMVLLYKDIVMKPIIAVFNLPEEPEHSLIGPKSISPAYSITTPVPLLDKTFFAISDDAKTIGIVNLLSKDQRTAEADASLHVIKNNYRGKELYSKTVLTTSYDKKAKILNRKGTWYFSLLEENRKFQVHSWNEKTKKETSISKKYPIVPVSSCCWGDSAIWEIDKAKIYFAWKNKKFEAGIHNKSANFKAKIDITHSLDTTEKLAVTAASPYLWVSESKQSGTAQFHVYKLEQKNGANCKKYDDIDNTFFEEPDSSDSDSDDYFSSSSDSNDDSNDESFSDDSDF